MTPVVNLQYGVFHRQVLDPVLELFIKHFAVPVKIFVIYAHRQHKVAEFPVWNLAAPRHFVAGFKRIVYILQKEFAGIVCHVRHRHVGVQNFQCLLLFRRQFSVKDAEVLFAV